LWSHNFVSVLPVGYFVHSMSSWFEFVKYLTNHFPLDSIILVYFGRSFDLNDECGCFGCFSDGSESEQRYSMFRTQPFAKSELVLGS